MKITKIISTICAIAMCASSFSFASYAQEPEAIVSVKENFNQITVGDIPSGFITKEAGNANVGVVNVPDKENKSLYMRSSAASSAYIRLNTPNPQNNGLTISFRFMLPELCELQVPSIIDAKGNSHSILSFKDSKLYVGDRECGNIVKGVWHYIKISLNFEKMNYRVSFDGNDVTANVPHSVIDIASVCFELTDIDGEMYIDDISIGKTKVGAGSAREYYPSELFLTDDQYAEVSYLQKNAVVMHKGSTRATIDGEAAVLSAPPVEVDKVLYAPLRFVAEALGGEVKWNDSDASTEVSLDGRNIKFIPESSEVSIDGEVQMLLKPVFVSGGSTYISASDIPLIFNTSVYTKDWLIYINGDPAYLDSSDDRVFDEVVNLVRYERPSGEYLASLIEERFPNKAHPRIFATADDFARVRQIIATDDFASKSFAYLKSRADEFLDTEPLGYVLEEGSVRLDVADDEGVSRIVTLSFVYQITGEEKYAARAWEEMAEQCSFKDWNPPHFLDAGKIMCGMATGYDWLYDYLDESQKAIVREALLSKGINVGLSVYRGNHDEATRTFWAFDEFNWNPCINLGMLAASIAICDEEPEMTVPCLAYALRSLEFHLSEFDPDGGWQEGPGYGSGTIFHDARILSLFDTAYGSDLGLTEVANIQGGCYFQLCMLGPQGLFNYGDGNQNSFEPYNYEFYFAKKLNDKSLGYHRKADIESRFYRCEPVELLWYDPQYIGDEIDGFDIDNYFRKSEVVALRSSWEDDGMFVGFLAGDNEAPHSHFDTGNYVFDWNGTRWASDYGMNQLTYSGTHTFEAYTGRAEGHNTLVMDETPYLDPSATGEWQILSQYFFDDIEEGGQPDLDNREKQDVTSPVGGTVRVTRTPVEGNPSNMALRINSPDENGNNGAFTQLLFGEPYPKTGIDVEFSVCFEDTNYTHNLPYVADSNKSGFAFLQFTKEGKILAVSGSSTKAVGSYVPGTWYNFCGRFNFKEQTYDLYMNGELVYEDLPFKAAIQDAYYIRYTVSAKKTAILIDDFIVRVHPDDYASVSSALRRYDQLEKSKAFIDRYESKPRGAYAISDITDAYRLWADSAVRGVKLDENRGALVIRDEIKLKGKTDVYWFSHQLKEIDVKIADDGKSAILTDKHGNRMWVGIISDTDQKFEVWECVPLPGSPNPAGQEQSLSKFNKLAIKFEGVEEASFSVAYIPLLTDGDVPKRIPKDMPLSEWSIPDGEIPTIDTITLDGKEIEGFKPSKTVYNIELRDDEKIPVVEAYANGVKLQVTQPSEAPGTAVFAYYSNGVEAEFAVNFTIRKIVRSSIQGYPITEDNITTSSLQQEQNPPKATIDGDNTTRWAAQYKGEWIIYDFEQERVFSQIDVGWYLGEKRKYDFEIQLSNDGANWTTVFKGTNSGTTGEPETYKFPEQNARYIKIIGNGSNENLWNNIAEVR